MDEKNYLIEFYYDYIKESYFVDALYKFAQKEGFGLEYVWCVFSDYYEPWEDEYFGDTGVAFYFEPPAVAEEKEIFLTNDEFYFALEKRAQNYILKNNDSAEEINALLLKVKELMELK